MGRKKRGRDLCGLMLLDKPRGLSSNQAMQQLRRLLDASKAGHGGALDPMAEGVLPILFGDATRLSQRALDGDKTYQFVMQLGARTDTGDADGEVVETCAAAIPSAAAIQQIIPRFLGEQTQIPPMYSALKRDGQPLYKLARKGQVVEREARSITVSSLVLDAQEDSRVRMTATVSKGTYIRTLAEDIAAALGQCAHLVYLRRQAAAGLSEPLVTLEQVEALSDAERLALLQPLDQLLPEIPVLLLDAPDIAKIQHGQPCSPTADESAAEAQERLLLDAQGRAIGIAVGRDGQWWPQRVFAAAAKQPPCVDALQRAGLPPCNPQKPSL